MSEIPPPNRKIGGLIAKVGVKRKDRPQIAKVGYKRKGWGQNAKDIRKGKGMTRGKGRADCPIGKNAGGAPRKHPIQKVLNKERLMEVAKDRGFSTYKDFYDYLTEALYEKRRYVVVNKMSYGTWTYPDICLLSDALSLTPSEFLGVWFANLFHEVDGQIIAKIPEEDKHLYIERKVRSRSGDGGKNDTSLREKQKTLSEVKEFLEKLE